MYVQSQMPLQDTLVVYRQPMKTKSVIIITNYYFFRAQYRYSLFWNENIIALYYRISVESNFCWIDEEINENKQIGEKGKAS